jgi:hypothetical protein
VISCEHVKKALAQQYFLMAGDETHSAQMQNVDADLKLIIENC